MCSRCLGAFLCPINFTLKEEFFPTVDMPGGRVLSVQESLGCFTISSDTMLDERELIRQYTLLNLPMKPLCQPDCTGIREE